MSNLPIVITGTQRSGTTLLNLILDSHPLIKGVDEMNFRPKSIGDYLEHPDYHPCVSLKLPQFAHALSNLKMLRRLKVLWCIRDPRDVVLSMITLKIQMGDMQFKAWANHPAGATAEITNCVQALGYSPVNHPILNSLEYTKITKMPFVLRGRKEAIFMAAVCWQFKQELLQLYDKENIPHIIITYEELITHPKNEISRILNYLELPWHDDVLRHHEIHEGTSVGQTVNNKPIDASNMGKWVGKLSDEELAVIAFICADTAGKFGYKLTSSATS
jgi:Sulfotransferase domain